MTVRIAVEKSEADFTGRCMRLSDAIQAQTNGLLDRIDANPNDHEARQALLDLGRELADQGCGLLGYVDLDVSPVSDALNAVLDSTTRSDHR